MTAQPNAHIRFRRAIERRALWMAEDAARELPTLSLEHALSEPTRRRLAARVAPLWPPGPYALAVAAVKAVTGITGRTSGLVSCFVAPDDGSGRKSRVVALPVRLGPSGIVAVETPPLNSHDHVALDNAMLL